MPVSVAVEEDAVRIGLTRWAAVAAVERELRVPLSAVRAVSAEGFDEKPRRVLGTSKPVTRKRYGRSPVKGDASSLALNGEGPTLLLGLDPARMGYDVVAVSLADAEHVPAELEAALR